MSTRNSVRRRSVHLPPRRVKRLNDRFLPPPGPAPAAPLPHRPGSALFAVDGDGSIVEISLPTVWQSFRDIAESPPATKSDGFSVQEASLSPAEHAATSVPLGASIIGSLDNQTFKDRKLRRKKSKKNYWVLFDRPTERVRLVQTVRVSFLFLVKLLTYQPVHRRRSCPWPRMSPNNPAVLASQS
jgi:hypothetical protein